MSTSLTLVSHGLCPYVQRAAIVLHEKGVAFERRDIDLGNKPDWFLKISPLGKTPVLLVDDQAIFESAVICEFLDETEGAPLHPQAPLQRAKHRAWVEFGSAILNAVGSFYSAADESSLADSTAKLRHRFEQVEAALDVGPYFAGQRFGLVDAAFGPVFRYFDVFDTIDDFGFFANLPKVQHWRKELSARPSIVTAVSPDYPELLRSFLLKRKSELSRRMGG